MTLFIDTSALVKLFYEEEESDIVTDLITQKENDVWVLETVKIEFYCAIFRRFRNNEINEENLNDAISGFEEELTNFNVEILGQATIIKSEDIIKKYGKTEGLRALDALQLGAFSIIADEEWILVAADERLCEIARKMGFNTINPL